MRTLRPYQQQVVDDLKKRFNEVSHPLLLNMSVGSGKSLIIAEFLRYAEAQNLKVLCLTMNSILVKQNAETFEYQGGEAGVYCSSLNRKDIYKKIIFASVQSVYQAIFRSFRISFNTFDVVVIDECHNLNHLDSTSMYMRIINHYGQKAQINKFKFNVIGLTGTPFRARKPILGDDMFFKEQICDISAEYLIEKGYLTPPTFEKPEVESYALDKVPVAYDGGFRTKDLEIALSKQVSLTQEILREIVQIVENGNRKGAFIFASTKRHAKECMEYLPSSARIVLANTSHAEREEIIKLARIGKVKYLVNVATLLTGVDVAIFDTCAFLRPTESIVLYTQAIGRVLRLHPYKHDALILDYAGNIERHQDADSLFIEKAFNDLNKEEEYCLPCFKCNTLNKESARRCRGRKNNKRCEHYFKLKPCDNCGVANDITARECRLCEFQLVDPDAKLSLNNEFWYEVDDYKVYYKKTAAEAMIFVISYKLKNGKHANEIYFLTGKKALDIFYHKFIKHHVREGLSRFYQKRDEKTLKILVDEDIRVPVEVVIVRENQFFKVKKKRFENGTEVTR